MTQEKFSLKDHLFNQAKIEKIADELQAVYPKFSKHDFVQTVVSKFPDLELKQRITWIAECLKQYLPADYEKAVSILCRALPQPCDPTLSDDDFGDFIYAPYNEFVAKYGCSKRYLEVSLDAIHQITTRFSAEDAIRYFINAFPDETLARLRVWVGDSHYHVRRLVSEGTRPKLPWAQKIGLDMKDPLPFLDALHADSTRFVTRSVANHVNDISKRDPDLALDLLEKWQALKAQQPEELAFVVKHALRGLVKAGHPRALAAFGVKADTRVLVKRFVVRTPQVVIGEALNFECELCAESDETVIVDYVIYFQNKAGELKNKKVFKLKQTTLKANECVVLSKNHMFRAGMTTRALYPGLHAVEIQVNGAILARETFRLQEAV